MWYIDVHIDILCILLTMVQHLEKMKKSFEFKVKRGVEVQFSDPPLWISSEIKGH